MSEHLLPAEKPITDSDAFIAQQLEGASIPTLMMSLVHLTGDTGVLRGAIRPKVVMMGGFQGGLSAEDQASVRRLALKALIDYRDRGCTLPPQPSPELVQEMMNFMVGERVGDEYVPMMLEELALDGNDSRAPRWSRAVPAARRENFHVLVIGAGMSGLLQALRLKEAGIPFTVVEKNDSVGGTWYENRYPGCRVDIANHFYSYSFEPYPWSEYFSRRDELLEYFRKFVERHALGAHIQFGTEVSAARYDESAAMWQVELISAGKPRTLRVNAIVSAVGQLNRPRIPEIAGRETFTGAQVHSAEWDAQLDLTGKRVAVLGSGASAFQLVPEVAKVAGKLFVFQRSAPWMLPNPLYHEAVSAEFRWLVQHVPYYARWFRFLIFYPGSDGILPALRIDKQWAHPERAVNALNDQYRGQLIEYMKAQVNGNLELLQKVTPKFPFMGKRMLQDNGSWLQALQRPNVELIDEGVTRIDEQGIVASSGHYPVDVIIYATGFHATKFLWPMQVVGRHGKQLAAVWGDEPRAYLGITVPDFPNLFCLYGPATNLAHAGSIIFHSECQVRYATACIQALLENDIRAMECRREVYEDYTQRLIAELDTLVWSHPACDSWYRNRAGRVVTTSPWRLADYWKWTRAPDLSDYTLIS
ncbi:MAG TPA: NAD(P)/FAD-dependent oxidoreductase [Steroidobacteraceae bacterium]|jgi:4-hydroxyacetophenone monooxygenase|nr:NAD(P)/FAD-dependent oxidoreductase [Steroidobacteraceae bacterium]